MAGAGSWQFRAGLDAGGGFARWGDDGDAGLVLASARRAAEGQVVVSSMPVGATVTTDSSTAVPTGGGGAATDVPVSGVGTAMALEAGTPSDDPNRGPVVPAGSQPNSPRPDDLGVEARLEADLEEGELARNEAVQLAITSGEMMSQRDAWMVGHGSGRGGRAGGWASLDRRSRNRGDAHFWSPHGLAYPIAFNHAGDPRLDDLSEHVPALFPGPIDGSIAELEVAAGGKRGSVDAAARGLIDAARRALPIGVYRLGDGPSIAVGPGGTLAWRHVDANGLEELARWDGARLRRAYPELGLEVARDLGERSPAVALTVMPLLVAPADDLARWFVVTARGRTLYLAAAKDPAQVLLTIELDDKHRVIAIKTVAGDELVSVTWGAQGPVSARLGGEATSIGFTTAADPVALPADLAVVSLPLPQLARAQTAAQAAVAGTPAWREAQRRVLAAAAAVQDVGAARGAFEALLDHGGVQLGDVVLAGAGLTTGPQALFDRAVASFGANATAIPPAVRYLAASRVYRAKATPEVLAPGSDAGVVGGLWRYRQVLALIAADKRLAAVTALEAMGDRAPELQLIAASMIGQQWSWPAALMGRAWDAVAQGDLRNIARYEAARAFTNRGEYAAAADRFAALLADVDLAARPAPVDYMLQTAMYNSPRGQAGFDMAWRGFSTRIIADAGVDHVIALAHAATQLGRTADADAALGRVIELVGTDREGMVEVLGLAFALGQTERATALLPTVLAGDPEPEVLRIASQVAMQQGRSGEAADYLEQAMAKEEGPTPLAAVRGDYAQLIGLRGRIAQLSIGQEKEDAVEALLRTVRAWREMDPANPQIDVLAGQMLLSVGKTEEAMRHLATAIEREPMEGTGWILVADTLERNGRYSEALETWQQAVVIDQTNPGPRLRLAQLCYAMGMSEEGDQVLRDASGRKWHDRFVNDVWQLESLARQRGIKK
jgi:tetratricopeptide (TPR) repeat protein